LSWHNLKYAAIEELSFGSGNDKAITATSSASACLAAAARSGLAAGLIGWRTGALAALSGRKPAVAADAVFAFALILIAFLLAWPPENPLSAAKAYMLRRASEMTSVPRQSEAGDKHSRKQKYDKVKT
jgi:hypothetical protein